MSDVPMWRIRIDDSHCEWEFCLQGGEDCCIDDLLQIILVHTRMRVVDERLVEPNSNNGTNFTLNDDIYATNKDIYGNPR